MVKEHWQVKRYVAQSNVSAVDIQVKQPEVRSEFFRNPVKRMVKGCLMLEEGER